MSQTVPTQTILPRLLPLLLSQRLAWLHIVFIAVLMVSRRPDAIFHPQFWGEDGQVFYHDAYMLGLPALLMPLGGYLNTLSRLGAAFTVNFPLVYAPYIYAGIAFGFQLLPALLLLSRRMETALPSSPARLLMAYFYAALPNSYELNLILTNAQWHLAMAAFLILLARPAASPAGRTADGALLALSGVSGPFGIFLLPIAWLEAWQRPATQPFRNAAIITLTAALQLGIIITNHAMTARVATPLGATPLRFLQIVDYQIIFSGTVGYRVTAYLLLFPYTHWVASLLAIMGGAVALLVLALRAGPPIYRKAAFWAGAMFAAALVTPLSSTTIAQWAEMTHRGASVRYYVVPTLVWFATLLIAATSRWRAARCAGYVLLAATFFGLRYDWILPPFRQTDFYAQAAQFDAASSGVKMSFPENPFGWTMTLTKR